MNEIVLSDFLFMCSGNYSQILSLYKSLLKQVNKHAVIVQNMTKMGVQLGINGTIDNG